MLDYFFYGTLMDMDVLSRVVGRAVPPAARSPARLHGYKRVYVAGALFPVLVPAPENALSGVVIGGLDARERERIHAFEDDGYGAVSLTVTDIRRGAIRALVFMPGPRLEATAREWDFDDWRRRHKRLYLQRIWGS